MFGESQVSVKNKAQNFHAGHYCHFHCGVVLNLNLCVLSDSGAIECQHLTFGHIELEANVLEGCAHLGDCEADFFLEFFFSVGANHS